ncbi:MAG: metalloprotease family protein [Thermacetogeniaceae bacterium]
MLSFMAQLLMLAAVFLTVPRTTFALSLLAIACLPPITAMHEFLHLLTYKAFGIECFMVLTPSLSAYCGTKAKHAANVSKKVAAAPLLIPFVMGVAAFAEKADRHLLFFFLLLLAFSALLCLSDVYFLIRLSLFDSDCLVLDKGKELVMFKTKKAGRCARPDN